MDDRLGKSNPYLISRMKEELMRRCLAVGMLLAVGCGTFLFAGDPVGTWVTDGRADFRTVIAKAGNQYEIRFTSNHGKYQAVGYLNDGSFLLMAYQYTTENAYGFIVFEMVDGSTMKQQTFDKKGKLAWSGTLRRAS
jgi:hypothetical protein